MPKIFAIVMTYDKNRIMTEHMIYKYNQIWPDHPFIFRIPYQDANTCIHESDQIQYIQTDKSIKPSVLRLLEDLDDEAWIYWCIDDKYPIELETDKISAMFEWVATNTGQSWSGLLFCRCRSMWNKNYLTNDLITDADGNQYHERNTYEQIWIHQFLKVKVIRHLFNAFPDQIPLARSMDLYKETIQKPYDHRILVTDHNFSTFGESSSYGKLTRNCYQSLLDNNFTIPTEFQEDIDEESIFMGHIPKGFIEKGKYKCKRLVPMFNKLLY